jgi:[acyl-carrier-protein] S-malonyltransferase
MDAAVEAAEAVLADENATQKDVDKAAAAVNNAVDALVKKGEEPPVVDRTELDKAIADAEKVEKDKYTDDSVAALEEALAAAKAIRFEDALRLVAIRAQEMQKCCEMVPGTMAAILGLDNLTVEMLCAGCDGLVLPANYNCDGQVVISGEKEAVEQACAKAKESGAKRALPLPVSGAFHSPLMEPARVELAKAIEQTEIVQPCCPVYQNVCASPVTNPKEIKKNLLTQLTSPVKWTQSVQAMLANGADWFMEVGPGTVLQGLVRRISGGLVNIEGIQ